MLLMVTGETEDRYGSYRHFQVADQDDKPPLSVCGCGGKYGAFSCWLAAI